MYSRLEGGMDSFESLDHYLTQWSSTAADRHSTATTVLALARACGQISTLVAQGPLAAGADRVPAINPDGELHKQLDLQANELLITELRRAPVAQLVSEELQAPLSIEPAAPLNVAIEPLNGSSNIDTNLSVGTIFSIWPATRLLQPGAQQCAAGYVIYGPQIVLVLSLGSGTQMFTLDPRSGQFRLTTRQVVIPQTTHVFAINVSNFRHWDRHIRAYIDDCLAGEKGPRECNYNMRWVASLVAECHRILLRGGIYLYPGDARPGYAQGRLRLVYELNPIAWLIEQAAGAASTGTERILDLAPTNIHQRAPLIFGSAREVARVDRYYTELHTLGERSPLFNQRGLFRNSGSRT